MSNLIRWIRNELGLGRAILGLALLAALAQGLELYALTKMTALGLGPLPMAQVFWILGLFVLKGVCNVIYQLRTTALFVGLRYRIRTMLFRRLDVLEFVRAKSFVSDRLGFVGRGLPESLLNVITASLQLVWSLVFLIGLAVIALRFGTVVAMLGFGLAAMLFGLSLTMNRFLKSHARRAFESDARFERQWSEQIQVWLEKRLLRVPTTALGNAQEFFDHRDATLRRDFWRSVQSPVLEVIFLASLLAILAYFVRIEQQPYAVIVTGVIFLQRMQSRVQGCLTAWQQLRDEWPMLREIGLLPTGVSENIARPSTSNLDGVFVEDLRFGYAGTELFHGLSFHAEPGEWIRISGPNGTGKTTLGQILMGVLTPKEGLVRAAGRVGMLTSQATILDGDLTMNLDFGRGFTAESMRARVDRFDLGKYFERWSKTVSLTSAGLSAGEKQLVGLGRMLMEDLDVLILDEATSHLSEELEGNVLNALKREFPRLIVFLVGHRESHETFVSRALDLAGPSTHLRLVTAVADQRLA